MEDDALSILYLLFGCQKVCAAVVFVKITSLLSFRRAHVYINLLKGQSQRIRWKYGHRNSHLLIHNCDFLADSLYL